MASIPDRVDSDLLVDGNARIVHGAGVGYLPIRRVRGGSGNLRYADRGKEIVCEPPTRGRMIFTLASVTDDGMAGAFFRIRNDSTANLVVCRTVAGQNIDGADTYTLGGGEWVDIVAWAGQRRWVVTSPMLPYRQPFATHLPIRFNAMPGVFNIMDCATGQVQGQLPSARDVPGARFYFFAMNASASNRAIVRPTPIELIHGMWHGDNTPKGSIGMNESGQFVSIINDGAAWYIASSP